MKVCATTLALMLSASSASAASITLDFDTPATGSGIIAGPLVTPFGTVTALNAELNTPNGDAEFIAAGAIGNNIDHLNAPPAPGGFSTPLTAALLFDFDVDSLTLIYGGNSFLISFWVRDVGGSEIASLLFLDTTSGPAGPITFNGPGIRRLEWSEPDGSFAALDNITLNVADAVPEPTSMLLLGTGLLAAGVRRYKWDSKSRSPKRQ
jgi:hypothetical protein